MEIHISIASKISSAGHCRLYHDPFQVNILSEEDTFQPSRPFGRLIYPGVAQLVGRVAWDHEVRSSNLLTRTIETNAISMYILPMLPLAIRGGLVVING